MTGRSLVKLMQGRVFRPLGLRHTHISALPPIPQPVLDAYVNVREVHEDSTSWSPSWGLPKGLLMTSTVGDVIKSAKALRSGALVSPKASRERIAPITVGLSPGFSDQLYYGLGVLVANGWLVQNPMQNGYTSIMAYEPSGRIAIALSVTEGEQAATTPTNYSERLLKELTEYLTPDKPAALPNS